MADPGCDFADSADAEPCGKTPTQMLSVGMTAPDPATRGAGHAGDFVYGHYCEEHLPVVQRKMGQRKD